MVLACVKRALDKLGADCQYIKLHGEEAQSVGVDLLGTYCGRAFAIEVKRPALGVTTERQKRFLRAWHKAGAIVAVVTSAEEALLALRHGVTSADLSDRPGPLPVTAAILGLLPPFAVGHPDPDGGYLMLPEAAKALGLPTVPPADPLEGLSVTLPSMTIGFSRRNPFEGQEGVKRWVEHPSPPVVNPEQTC